MLPSSRRAPFALPALYRLVHRIASGTPSVCSYSMALTSAPFATVPTRTPCVLSGGGGGDDDPRTELTGGYIDVDTS
ncbi:hypothetical protein L1887_62326 [Cichorium endivia]|nr:hypothetical protein L1887_62326 [Cichorium endivia]